ncbi:major facilitator superfamily domain-containing protein [Immersiella caudata]|uniref:Major facilitator superfamily domain-containing protein n=1 Tax=Immersiella caudata TaxID=314043 RepID=A0AA39TYW2_9PEZI|nr:major facilitator superfamily domain-containing protein [Immersiella caudata]
MAVSNQPRKKWYQLQWYRPSDSARQRRFINKIGLVIVPYAFLSYWVKYIDQANVNNAYVAGMKEDLGFYGNELIQLQTFYVVGAVLGQIPFMFFLDVAWGIFTLRQYRTASFAELAAYRFLVGWRCLLLGLSLGTLTAGLITAGASRNLEGVLSLTGWRWMYIICAIITIPVGILRYFILPGTPDKPNKWFLHDEDLDVARDRLKDDGHHTTNEKVTFATVKKVASTWHFWVLIVFDFFFWNSGTSSVGGFLLWLKPLNRFSKARINGLGAIASSLGMFYTLLTCLASDLILGPTWAITFIHTFHLLGNIILTVWTALYGWVNTKLRGSPAQRAFILVLINTTQASTAWTYLLTFPTAEAPRYPKGYPFAIANSVALILTAHALKWWLKKTKE